MLDPKVTDLAGRTIGVRLEEYRKQLGRELEIIQNDLSTRGVGRSGLLVRAVYERCEREVEIRVGIVWQVLLSVLSATNVRYSESLAHDLKDELERYFPPDMRELNEIIARHADLVGSSRNRLSVDGARTHALRKIGAEIDRYALSLQSREELTKDDAAPLRPIYHFHGPVGAVQTGEAATANVLQQIGSGERESLLRALKLLRRELNSIHEIPGSPKEELVELIDEAELEVGKSKPNASRFRAILSEVGGAVQTVAAIQPAYQALKAALLPLGITLP